ncbi:hypothetical protein QFZ22_002636 [Streptomyces canus]|uniref:Uncharacterized protein n=1 Tax=Streptomyces canus TaxID=58343 RepID=A0AAW8F938_9ACTN|nr:hypothetical protein [Streptomyces canus]
MSPPRRPPPSPTRLRRTGHALSGTGVPWLPHCWRWSCPAGPDAATTTGRTSASVAAPGVAEFGGCVRRVAPRLACRVRGGGSGRVWSAAVAGCWLGWSGLVWRSSVAARGGSRRVPCVPGGCRVRGGGPIRLGRVQPPPAARRLRWSGLVWRSSVVASGRSRRVPGGGSGRVRPAAAVFPLWAGGGARGQGIRCAGSAPSRSTAWREPLPVGGEVMGGRVQSAVHQARQSPSRPEPPAA